MGLFSFLFKKKDKNIKAEEQVKPVSAAKPADTTPKTETKAEATKHQVKVEALPTQAPTTAKEGVTNNTAPAPGPSAKTEATTTKTTPTATANKAQTPKPAKTSTSAPKIEKETAKPEQVKKASPAPVSAKTKAAKAELTKETPASTDTVADEAAANSETVVEGKSTRSGKFEIKKAKDGRFVFNLYASNHVIVATSQVYTSAQSAMTGIKSVMTNASKAPLEDQTLKEYTNLPYPKWELYQDKGSQFRFRLLAANGSCVVHSQGYTTKANCKKGIESIIKFAEDAEISKAYLKKEQDPKQ